MAVPKRKANVKIKEKTLEKPLEKRKGYEHIFIIG